jgi:cytosine deaminase
MTQPRTLLSGGILEDGSKPHLLVDDTGTIMAMSERREDVESPDATVIDLDGRLLLPSLVEPHAHLDKSLTADVVPNPKGDLMGAILGWREAESSGVIAHDEMVQRITRSLEMLLKSGVTLVRSHINVGGPVSTRYLVAAIEAAQQFKNRMDIEFVALTYMPMSGEGSDVNLIALNEAIELGVDVIGGCPHLEPDPDACVSIAFELAERHGRKVDLHVDETLDPTALTISDVIRYSRGSQILTTASHCVSLGMLSTEEIKPLANAIAEADISIIALPQTNLFLQGRDDPVATPRGLTAIHELRAAGVNLVAGADNAQDPFNFVGRNDPFETAALMVMAGHMLPADAFSTITSNARAAIGAPPVNIAVGESADLLAVRATTTRQAVAEAPADRVVLKGGRVVATTTVMSELPALIP